MEGIILCKTEQEWQDAIKFTKEHKIYACALTDQDECDHWFHQLHGYEVYEDGDYYGVVYMGIYKSFFG